LWLFKVTQIWVILLFLHFPSFSKNNHLKKKKIEILVSLKPGSKKKKDNNSDFPISEIWKFQNLSGFASVG